MSNYVSEKSKTYTKVKEVGGGRTFFQTFKAHDVNELKYKTSNWTDEETKMNEKNNKLWQT